MAGYYNSLKFDACDVEGDAYIHQAVNDYNLNLPAHFRVAQNGQGGNRAMPLSLGKQPDFYGPNRGRVTTMESFLQGRGQTLSKCPDCQVRYLPASLFDGSAVQTNTQCQRTDLEPLYTRAPKSCNGLPETDVSAYWMMPANYKKGYAGYRAVVDTNLQTRQPEGGEVTNGSESYGCRKSYGTYGSGRDFGRYAF